MLVSAAKTVFASSAPSLWLLAAMLAPRPLVPLIRALASAFPGKTLSGLFQAYEALYDVSACLIQVCYFMGILSVSTFQHVQACVTHLEAGLAKGSHALCLLHSSPYMNLQ